MIGCVPYYSELITSLTDHFPDHFLPHRILDLGCGNGNVTARLVPKYPNAKVTVVDASAQMIDLCRTKFKRYDFTYVNSYFKDFLFEKGKYDLIVAGFSLHHCDEAEKQSLFKKIYSALKSGGIFSCSDLMISKTNPEHPALIKQWKTFVNANFPDGKKWKWVMEHYRTFDRPTDYTSQVKWLEDAGFTTVSIPFRKGYWTHLHAVK